MPCCANTGLGQLNPRLMIDPSAFGPALGPGAASSQVAAHQARVTACNNTCSNLNQQFPSLYPATAGAGCRVQCMARKDLTPLASICQHRYVQTPDLVSACIAAGGGSPVTGGDAFPEDAGAPDQGGWPLGTWLIVGGATLGVLYVGYKLLKKKGS